MLKFQSSQFSQNIKFFQNVGITIMLNLLKIKIKTNIVNKNVISINNLKHIKFKVPICNDQDTVSLLLVIKVKILDTCLKLIFNLNNYNNNQSNALELQIV